MKTINFYKKKKKKIAMRMLKCPFCYYFLKVDRAFTSKVWKVLKSYFSTKPPKKTLYINVAKPKSF